MYQYTIMLATPSGRTTSEDPVRLPARRADANDGFDAAFMDEALAEARRAAAELGYLRLVGCTLYTTVEPCFMCAGALLHARIARVVWAVRDPKFGACASLGAVLTEPGLNHAVDHREGVRAGEARELLVAFFQKKRADARR